MELRLCALGVAGGSYFPARRFFLSVMSPTATKPNGLIYLAYVGAVLLAAGLATLGVGLIRK